MKKLINSNSDKYILAQVLNFARQQNVRVYVVGGFLRDIILGRCARPNPDIDFAISDNAIKFAAKLSKKLKAGFVVLDKGNGCARLVKRTKTGIYTLDFSDFRGKTLQHDLGKRDFTINAMAIELGPFLQHYKQLASSDGNNRSYQKALKSFTQTIVDPCRAIDDLKCKIIRMVSDKAYDDDPLRMLRAFSLSCVLNFTIQPSTLKLIKKKKSKLKKCSWERIRDELFKILVSPQAFKFLTLLDKHKLLELILPEINAMRKIDQGPHHHLDVWNHTLETVRHFEKIANFAYRNPDVRNFLDAEISSGRRRYELIKLAAVLHDAGKPKTLRIAKDKVMFYGHEHLGAHMAVKAAQRLRLSNDEVAALKRIVSLHLRPGYMADSCPLTPRAKFRFFRDGQDEAVSVLLLCLADQRATKGSLITPESRRRHERLTRSLIKEYFHVSKQEKAPRLINGHDLMKHFKLQPSSLIGKVLSEIEEVRAIGKIKTKKDALRVAKGIIKEGS